MTKPLQVYMDEADLQRLDIWSRQKGWTKSQAVRAAIRALTRPVDDDALLAASGMINGLPKDCSERIGRYLEETFIAEKKANRYRKTRSPRKPVR